MKKRRYLILLFFVMILFVAGLLGSEKTTVTVWMDGNGKLLTYVNHKQKTEMFSAVYNDNTEIFYFYLPSYVHNQKVYLDSGLSSEEEIWVGDEQVHIVEQKDCCFSVVFMHSANLPTVFLNTDSNSIEYVNEAKENREGGEISIMNADGEQEYFGRIDDIHGRGNSTWARSKKSYNITLHKPAPLCGLESGKKWVLLSLVFEDSKLNNMIALDLAREFGMEYASQATWVDLYIAGEYRGIYLLVEQITCDRGRVEIEKNKGSFLVEKEIPERFENEENKFQTGHEKQFVIKFPKNISEKQVDTIATRMNLVEEQLYAETPDFDNLIDLDSFATHFLIDEITNQIDSELTSMYFYQKKENGKIHAGPIWDYDYSFGTDYPDYSQSILEHELNDIEEYKPDYLHWYPLLCKNEVFCGKVRTLLLSKQKYFEKLLQKKIPDWEKMIRDSMRMDTVRWDGVELGTRYGCFEQDVRYLAFYLEHRINAINVQWGISQQYHIVEQTEEEHRVQFEQDGEILYTCYAQDASLMNNLPDKCVHSSWVFPGKNQSFCEYSPILDDLSIYCRMDWNGTDACKIINRLKQQTELEDYWKILQESDKALSFCVWIPEYSKLWTEMTQNATELFLVVDNGAECEWKSENGEALVIGTTFGKVDYGLDENDNRFLHIQEDETNYLSTKKGAENSVADIIFVVINRELGAIEDERSFVLP